MIYSELSTAMERWKEP